jgi:hypothetical protein
MDLTDIIIAVVALYGAGLSTYTLIQNNKEKRRQLKVHITKRFPVSKEGQVLKPDGIIIHIKNPGYKKVTVVDSQIMLPKEEVLIFPSPIGNIRFPYEIEEGKDCVVSIELQKVISGANELGYSGDVKLKAKVIDGAGDRYISKKALKLNLDEDID